MSDNPNQEWTGADWQNPDAQLYWDNQPAYTEEDKKVLTAASVYDAARARLSGREGDVEELWRVIVAADAFRETVGG